MDIYDEYHFDDDGIYREHKRNINSRNSSRQSLIESGFFHEYYINCYSEIF